MIVTTWPFGKSSAVERANPSAAARGQEGGRCTGGDFQGGGAVTVYCHTVRKDYGTVMVATSPLHTTGKFETFRIS